MGFRSSERLLIFSYAVHPHEWTQEHVAEFLAAHDLQSLIPTFKANTIRGRHIQRGLLTEQRLQTFGINEFQTITIVDELRALLEQHGRSSSFLESVIPSTYVLVLVPVHFLSQTCLQASIQPQYRPLRVRRQRISCSSSATGCNGGCRCPLSHSR